MDVGESDKDETETTIIEGHVDQSVKGLTKTQLKKLKKQEKREQIKELKRKTRKERQKAKKKLCRENGENPGPSRKSLAKTFVKMKDSSCKIKVVVDCSFDDYMAEKDIKHLVKQIMFSYSANRRAQSPLQFYCCGVTNKTKERLDSLEDSKFWDVHFHSESFDSIFDKSSIVYLSSESPNTLQSLEEDKVYIIGGLVDHNHRKGLCHQLAEEKGFSHAQLPISKYIDMKTRKVLSITHVFEILLHYTENRDWKKAFNEVLPQRKFAVKKKKSRRKEDLSNMVPGVEGEVFMSESNIEDSDKSESNIEDNDMNETNIEAIDKSETKIGGNDKTATKIGDNDKSETNIEDNDNPTDHRHETGDSLPNSAKKSEDAYNSNTDLDSSKLNSVTENGSCNYKGEKITEDVSSSVDNTEHYRVKERV